MTLLNRNISPNNIFSYWTLSNIFSIEMLIIFAFYRPKFDRIPVIGDLSRMMNYVWVAIAVLVSIYYIIYKRKFKINTKIAITSLLLLAFQCYSIISLAWTPDPYYYGITKNIMSTFVLVSTIICCMALIQDGCQSIEKFFHLFIFYAFMLSLIMILMGAGGNISGSAISSNYQLPGRIIALGGVAAITYILYGSVKNKDKVILFAIFIICTVALLSLGGRTGLLSMIFSVIGIYIAGNISSPLKILFSWKSLLLVIIILFSFVFIVNFIDFDHLPATLRRMSSMVETDGLKEENRFGRLYLAPEYFSQAPILGHGSGSWYFLEQKQDINYPHNIIIELFVELGIVGAFFFMAIVFYVIFIPKAPQGKIIPYHITMQIYGYSFVNGFHSLAMGDFSLAFGLYSSLFLFAGRGAFFVSFPEVKRKSSTASFE